MQHMGVKDSTVLPAKINDCLNDIGIQLPSEDDISAFPLDNQALHEDPGLGHRAQARQNPLTPRACWSLPRSYHQL